MTDETQKSAQSEAHFHDAPTAQITNHGDGRCWLRTWLMKMLFSSAHTPEVELLKGELVKAGIQCEVRNENLYSIFPGASFQPELWILIDDDYSKAADIRDTWIRTSTESPTAWICLACGEQSEGQFSSCWKCGADRDAASR